MTIEEAYEILLISESDNNNQAVISASFKELYNEYHTRITNAPTEGLRKTYQLKFDRIQEAYFLLTGNSNIDDSSELPLSGQSKVENSFIDSNSDNFKQDLASENNNSFRHDSPKKQQKQVSDLKDAYVILGVSIGAPFKTVLKNYQKTRAELLKMSKLSSRELADEALSELKIIEKAIYLINSSIVDREMFPEKFSKMTAKLNPPDIKYFKMASAVILVLILGYFLISSDIFKPNYEKRFMEATKLFYQNYDYDAADEKLSQLINTPLEEKALALKDKIHTARLKIVDDKRANFEIYFNKNDFIMAEKYLKEIEEIMDIEKYDPEFKNKWNLNLGKLESQKKLISKNVKEFESNLSNYIFIAAKSNLDNLKTLHYENDELSLMTNRLIKSENEYNDCIEKINLVTTKIDFGFQRSQKMQYDRMLELVEEVINTCPNIQKGHELKKILESM